MSYKTERNLFCICTARVPKTGRETTNFLWAFEQVRFPDWLLFTLQQILQTATKAGANRADAGANHADAAARDEEDGEAGQGNLGSVAAFSKTEVQEDRKAFLRLSCREQKWKKEETENMEHCLVQCEPDSL